MAEPVSFLKYSFVAGEISPKLFGRSDLEKYDFGLATAVNWFVDFTGGLSNRPGTRLVDFVEGETAKLFGFRFAPAVERTYVIVAGDEYFRFVQDGAYVLEAAKTITNVTESSGNITVTSAAHGFSNGDLVYISSVLGTTEINQRTFLITSVATDTFVLQDIWGDNIDGSDYTAYLSGGLAARVYTVATPYGAADLPLLRAHQARNTVIFTHPNFKRRRLTRSGHTSWALALEATGPTIASPGAITITPSTAGTAGVAFCVTAVTLEGEESSASPISLSTTVENYTTVAGESCTVNWTPIAGAVRYNIYRSRVFDDSANLSRNVELGYIGTSFGAKFIDDNIIPDFTITPPQYRDPFADGAILHIDVTAGGSSYTNASVVSATGGGTGFSAYPIIHSGALVGIQIVNPGSGYVNPVISVSVGTGATFSVTQSPASGNDPRVSTVFQQRRVYAGSDNNPLGVEGSQPGSYTAFDLSIVLQEDDSYGFELDSEEVAPIEHLIPSRSGLIMASRAGIWHLVGGSGVAVTPLNALADEQSQIGISAVPPVRIETDLFFIEAKGGTARIMSYNDFSKVFASQDLSVLSAHLTDPSNPIVAYDYASDPSKLLYAVREDGTLLLLTITKEQNVFGWTRAETYGHFRDVLVMQEDELDVVYTLVNRPRGVGEPYSLFIEQTVRRKFATVEDAWFLDCALELPRTYPAATLTMSAVSGTAVTFTAGSAVFMLEDLGKVIRAGGGKAVIVEVTSEPTTTVVANIINEFDAVPQSTRPLVWASGTWTLDEPTATLSNLWHLEGQTVKALADGNVVENLVVENGSITLQEPASRIIVGLPYRAIGRTLPPTSTDAVVEDKRKAIRSISFREYESRGLAFGPDLDHMKEVPSHTNEPAGEPTRLRSRFVPNHGINSTFDFEGQFYFTQDYPLPATILSLAPKVDIGDASAKR